MSRRAAEDCISAGRVSVKGRTAQLGDRADPAADEIRFDGEFCSVTVRRDSLLELSPLYGNVLVKRLPEKRLLPVLRRTAGALQSAGLICPPKDRERLTELLVRAGVNRVTRAGRMSEVFAGEAHDGEYPLRRYVRAINVEA